MDSLQMNRDLANGSAALSVLTAGPTNALALSHPQLLGCPCRGLTGPEAFEKLL